MSVTLTSGDNLSLPYEAPFNTMKYISDSVISLQEALLQCPAQETSSQSSGRVDSPTPSAGEWRSDAAHLLDWRRSSEVSEAPVALLRVSRQHAITHSIFKQLGQGEGSSPGEKSSLLGQVPASRPAPRPQGLGPGHQASRVHGLPARDLQHGEAFPFSLSFLCVSTWF